MLQPRAALTVDAGRSRPARIPALRRAVTRIADTALGLDKLSDFYLSIPAARDAAQFVELAIANLGVTTRLSGCFASIPEEGPAIAVANHPFGGRYAAELDQ